MDVERALRLRLPRAVLAPMVLAVLVLTACSDGDAEGSGDRSPSAGVVEGTSPADATDVGSKRPSPRPTFDQDQKGRVVVGDVSRREAEVAKAFVAAAKDPGENLARLAEFVAPDGLTLGYRRSSSQRLSRADAANPKKWRIKVTEDEMFGLISPLEVVRTDQKRKLDRWRSSRDLEVLRGPTAVCHPPTPSVPDQFEDRRAVAIVQSVENKLPCLAVFAVDLYLDDEGMLEGVVFAMGAP